MFEHKCCRLYNVQTTYSRQRRWQGGCGGVGGVERKRRVHVTLDSQLRQKRVRTTDGSAGRTKITTIIIIPCDGTRIPDRNPQARQHCAWLTGRDCRRGGRAAQRKNVLNEGFNTKDDAILCFQRYV
ncbi:hypothetical protein QTP88_028022 [Uroleucon formosanum]